MTIEEIEQLVYEYGKDVYKFCYHLTLENDRTDELYQETFLKAVELPESLKKVGVCIFAECDKLDEFYGKSNSYAEKLALYGDYKFVVK